MPGKAYNRLTALNAYITQNNIVVSGGGLNARFSSFANTFQTRLNTSNGTNGALGGTLEAQVNGALAQVLRQAGNGTTTAVAARSADMSIATLVGGAGGVQPSMSPYHATLVRESHLVLGDAIALLSDLQPLSSFTDPGDAECLRALVRAEVNGLIEEFGYARLQPRQQRVRVFLGGLLGYDYDAYANAGVSSPLDAKAPPGDIQALVNVFNFAGPMIPTLAVEDQLASQVALASDAVLFDTQWKNFWSIALRNSPTSAPTPGSPAVLPWALWEWPTSAPTVPSGLGRLLSTAAVDSNPILFGPSSPQLPQQVSWRIEAYSGPAPSVSSVSYAEKMIQVDLLLPVIAQDASRVETDLTAVGFTPGEQETSFAWLWSAVDADLLPAYPYAPAPGLPVIPAPPNSWPGFWTSFPLQTLNTAAGAPVSGTPTPIPVWTTVADILDWAQNLAGPTSADYLRQAGALGLNLICDQADELCHLVLAMLHHTASTQISALADTEVQLELVSLATDLNTLANLAY
jgi:hypothetical protein